MSSTLRNFNVKAGLSVGPQSIDVIDTNGNATFSSLTVNNNADITGNITVSGNTTLGNITNVKITGGNSGQVPITDGAGNLTWGSVPASTIVNGTSNIAIPTTNGPISLSVGGTMGLLTVNRISTSIAASFIPQATNTYNMGNAMFRWQGVFSTNVTANTLIGTPSANSNIAFTTTGMNFSANGTANVVTISTTGIAVTGRSSATEFFVLPTYTAANLRAITGQAGWTAAVSDSNPGGKHAYWDTTNARWSYINDDSAV